LPDQQDMTLKFVLLGALVLSACHRSSDEDAISQPAPPPATALALNGKTLDASLIDLEHELSLALGSGIDKGGEEHMLRAEAITDRLLENQLPFTWTGLLQKSEAGQTGVSSCRMRRTCAEG
jgi:hypothetical protein